MRLKWAATETSCDWLQLRLTQADVTLRYFKFKDLFYKLYPFPMRFCSSYFENRQLNLVSTDSSCSGWFWVTTVDSSYGWFALRQLIRDFRRLIWDLRLNWLPPEFWLGCPLVDYKRYSSRENLIQVWDFHSLYDHGDISMIYSSEAYSEAFQTSKIEYFPKIVDGLTISTKHSILDILSTLLILVLQGN